MTPLLSLAEGLCECGCGLPAPVSRRSDAGAGYVRGQPLRFIKGHARPRLRAAPPAVLLSVERRAWLAGFVDGEGCLSAMRTADHAPSARVQISQKDRSVLDLIREELGYGVVHRQSQGTHCLRIAAAHEVRHFIRLIYPYAIVKREKLRIAYALATAQTYGTRFRQHRYDLAQDLLVRKAA